MLVCEGGDDDSVHRWDSVLVMLLVYVVFQLQDKNWKIQVEKSEKDRLKSDFQSRLNMNNKQWEKNLVRQHSMELTVSG